MGARSGSLRHRMTMLCAAGMTATLVAGVVPAPAGAWEKDFALSATAGRPQSYPEDTPALSWAIKRSWMKYSQGIDHIFDGAVKDGRFGLRWPLVSADPVTADRIHAQYAGSVNFLKYCDNNDDEKRGECLLDVSLKDPELTYNPTTGEGELWGTVMSRLLDEMSWDSATSSWMGPERIKLADLSGGMLSFTNAGGSVTLRGVDAFISEPLALAMMGYEPGQRIDSLDFTVPGYLPGPLSAPHSPWRVETTTVSGDSFTNGGWYLIDDTHLANYGTYIDGWFVGPKVGVFTVIDRETGKATARKEVRADGETGVVFDAKNSRFLMLAGEEQQLVSIPVTADGIGQETVAARLGDGEGTIVAASPDTGGGIVFLEAADDGDSALRVIAHRVDADGNDTIVGLPATVDGAGGSSGGSTPYFQPGTDGLDTNTLVPLPDGSFLLRNPRPGGVPVRLDLSDGTASVTPLVTESPWPTESETVLDRVRVTGDSVIVFGEANFGSFGSTATDASRTFTSYRYVDGQLSVVGRALMDKDTRNVLDVAANPDTGQIAVLAAIARDSRGVSVFDLEFNRQALPAGLPLRDSTVDGGHWIISDGAHWILPDVALNDDDRQGLVVVELSPADAPVAADASLSPVLIGSGDTTSQGPAVTAGDDFTVTAGDTVDGLPVATVTVADPEQAVLSVDGLPAGLTAHLGKDGAVTVSGTPAAAAAPSPVRVTVTDSFLRTADGEFTITVATPLTERITVTPKQHSITVAPHTPVDNTLIATISGDGAGELDGIVFDGLPPGLEVSWDKKTGAVTVAGTAAQSLPGTVAVTATRLTAGGGEVLLGTIPLTLTAPPGPATPPESDPGPADGQRATTGSSPAAGAVAALTALLALVGGILAFLTLPGVLPPAPERGAAP
ncbi:HtaA domain-containing protein [Corynebacterium mendelii]|uniref:HtaA domain-containing protein n=1 Tax=Corynebacterium mendelii TaxID=2765362 RepID=A0A939E0F3_9CORY|nr:HtaA domain-containing protein [Corynebacterium mendelii]MBN9644650.1 HtaA domain-containing protein [Corynebacterium mendelii]